uniref:Uncharacterized protein n=1 Tax=Chenopodium quinoa TaxID=63459 RepID=A0A803N410_CHEQI
METMIDEGQLWRLGFWWKDINVTVNTYSIHHVVVDVCDHNNNPIWRAVGVYGWPEQENKHLTWAMLRRIKAGSSRPCVMFGDFNEIVSHEEEEGGVPRSESLMDAFRGAIDDCGLKDLGYKCSIFTWKRECSKVVDNAWVSIVGKDAASRIALCGEHFSLWAAKQFGDIKKKIRGTKEALKEIQGRLPDATMFEQCEALSTKLDELHRIEEFSFDPELRVSELIDLHCGEWNEDVLRQLFPNEICKLILQLPLSNNLPRDTQYWWPTSNGEFSVKSAYWLGKLGATHVLNEDERKVWSVV